MYREYFTDWSNLIDDDVLTPVLSKLDVMYSYHIVTPHQMNTFKAFTECPYKDLKVVILGQEPYVQPNMATGLAFGNPENTKLISPSLDVIKESLSTSDTFVQDEDFDITLNSWAKQGVLLLNSALTVNINKPNSHIDMWRNFIANVLTELKARNPGIVYILFGSVAKTFEAYIDHTQNLVLLENHPSFYARMQREMSDRVFVETNKYLKDHYNQEIKWI